MKRYLHSAFMVFCIAGLYGCHQRVQPPLFELLHNTGIDFKNIVVDTKENNIFKFRNFYNGGGVGVGDINNDGLPDVFFTANQGANKLYLNKGNFVFDDISEKAGFKKKPEWSTGVVMVDINSDGWLDIYVCNSSHMNDRISRANQLFINNHNLTFTEAAKEYGLDDMGYTTQVSFFDYDMDEDLDCFIINNSPIPVNTINYAKQRELPAQQWAVPDFLKGGGDHLLRNDNGKFVEVTQVAGIHGSLISFGLGVTVSDVNGDGYLDVYVSNDFFERDYLYINQKNGTFKDEIERWVQHTSLASMGADIADVNNDGFSDIFTTDMLPDDDYRLKTTSSFDNYDIDQLRQKSGFYRQYMQNTLQLNNGDGHFFDIARFSGVSASDWSWGAMLFDADNDGYTDIYVCNGIYRDVTDQDFIDFFASDVVQKMALTGKKEEISSIINNMPSQPIVNKFFRNTGHLKFEDNSEKYGFTQPSFSNGAAYADLDNDGDLDIVINNVNEQSFIYKNNSRQQNKNNYIGFILKGKYKNSFAIGAKIKLFSAGQILSREVMPSKGFQSSTDYAIEIGLAKNKVIDSIQIQWPDRTIQKVLHPLINTINYIQQKENGRLISKIVVEPNSKFLFQQTPSFFDKHTEDDFVDFYSERNIPERLSRQGPKAAVADVNGDGLEDIYIGGAQGQRGQLYTQTKTGFTKKNELALNNISNVEEVAVLFFDADKDSDMDLYIGAGGNNKTPHSKEMRHRLYKNDSKGNFLLDSLAFADNDANIAVTIANDFDNDGDLDLFIGGRNVSYFYGKSPRSYIMVNNGKGHFTDATEQLNAAIVNIGMVTGAVWANVIGDKQNELIITGEWMPTRIFSYVNYRFTEIKTNLSDLHGWWQTIVADDLDKDGYDDLIIGNIGENFYLQPNKNNPVKLWINDFDQNSALEKIITRTVNNKDVPVFLKRDITDQLPSLKKLNLKYASYAGKTMQALFPVTLLKQSLVKEFNYCSSIIALSNGKGLFNVQRMPNEVQFSSVNACVVKDLNNDGEKDILLAGNMDDFLPQFGRLDASLGHVLLSKGKNEWQWKSAIETGLQVEGAIKDIKCIKMNNKQQILFVRNNNYPVMYKINF